MRLLALLLLSSPALTQSPHLRVDPFGYEPIEQKVCVVRAAVQGYDAPLPYSPGATLQVIHVNNGTLAFSGAPVPWNGGAVHPDSGDRAWWFDFSGLTAPGRYVVRDPSTGATSEPFDVREDALAPARRAALRFFYYQRCGVAKQAAFAGSAWSDGACHVGALQDHDCRSTANPAGPGQDLWGGWHDAGDYNKYVNSADDTLHRLLGAYSLNPGAWDDAAGIPESGNGVPDLLDEVRFELEWLLRMQQPSGAVIHKVSVSQFQAASPPTADGFPRFHSEVTASATAASCAVFARGAHVFGGHPAASSQAFAAQLEAAALSAWGWLAANPGPSTYGNAGFLSANMEDPPWWQAQNRVNAAAWLARRTGAQSFHDYVTTNFDAQPEFSLLNPGVVWASPYEWTHIESLLGYVEDPAADPNVRQTLRANFATSVGNSWLTPVLGAADPYRAWMSGGDHTWGSNANRSHIGSLYALAARTAPVSCDASLLEQAARDHAHWLHGVNPTGLCFLSNMASYGIGNSVQETYHAWFDHNSIWDRPTPAGDPGPAPGFLTGGANIYFEPSAAYTGPLLAPPMNQPANKSYLDWNTSWPEESWEVTECSITYQGAYLMLLALVAPGDGDVQLYCAPTEHTAGGRAHLDASGGTSLGTNDLSLQVRCAPPQQFGLVFYGPSPARVPVGNGWRCVDSPTRITPPLALSGTGSASLALDLAAAPFTSGPGQVLAGQSFGFQLWYRDPQGSPATFNFSDALWVRFRP